MKLQICVIVALLTIQALIIGAIVFFIQNPDSWHVLANSGSYANEQNPQLDGTESYRVYIDQIFVRNFDEFEDAIIFALDNDNSAVIQGEEVIWDNAYVFYIRVDGRILGVFDEFVDAVDFARMFTDASVYFGKTRVWASGTEVANGIRIDVPLIMQLPRLARGCEVVSLAMILNHAGIDAYKMDLAREVRKNEIGMHQDAYGRMISGHPNDGFVGNIYTLDELGYGVYHRPIHELMVKYAGNSAMDLTGVDFEDLFYILNKGIPIWVITNSRHMELEGYQFQTWFLPTGESFTATWRLHSVVITGHDNGIIYVNDPLTGRIRVTIDNFRDAWTQMGRQAIAYIPRG